MVKVLENRIPPPIVMVVAALAMWALSWVTPTIPIPAAIRYGVAGVLFVIGFSARFQIIPEERVMQAKFGSAYDAYRTRVRRWL